MISLKIIARFIQESLANYYPIKLCNGNKSQANTQRAFTNSYTVNCFEHGNTNKPIKAAICFVFTMVIASAAHAGTEYTIGQFNMAGGAVDETADLKGHEAPDALIRSILDRQPAFMTIQEACRDWSEYMDSQLSDYTVIFDPVLGGDGNTATCKHDSSVEFGNAIVYRNDFGIDAAPVAYPLGSPVGLEQREMLCVESTTRMISVCSTHLSKDDESARQTEAETVHGILDLYYSNHIKFLGGDMNTLPLSGPVNEFYDTGYQFGASGNLKEVGSPCGNTIAPNYNAAIFFFLPCRSGRTTNGHWINRKKIDYLFYSPTVTTRYSTVTRAIYSDHDLLWGWIIMP